MESLGKAFDFFVDQGDDDFRRDGFTVFLHRFRDLLHPCRELFSLLERGESRCGQVEDWRGIINRAAMFDRDDFPADGRQGKEE